MSGDLHCHTLYSDGSTDTITIIKTAEKLNLSHISITDHDDFSAYNYIYENYTPKLGLIKGIEISSRDMLTKRRVHILCYLPKDESPINEITAVTRYNRKAQLEIAVEKISHFYPIDFDMIEKSRQGYGGYFKQHVINVMMKLGYTDKIFGELFEKLFDKNNGIAPTQVTYPDVYEVLEAVKKAGGVSVMAHPKVYNSIDLLNKLCRDKLIDGIEVYHPKQSSDISKYLNDLADEYHLIKTGGTDFHGYFTSKVNPIATCTTENYQIKRIFELAQSR